MIYNNYSDYLKKEYGQKIYKLPINLPLTCPNRDGCVGVGGCSYCGENALDLNVQEKELGVKEQLRSQIEHIKEKHDADKYIAYFQNYTNTYMPIHQFESYIKEAIIDDVVEIVISTRPDSIAIPYLEVLKKISIENNINITLELGLQTVNYKTLKLINRGHSLAEYIDSVLMIKKYDFKICTHLILNLPYDDMEDVIEMAKVVSSLKIDFVKVHSLYIVKGTQLEEEYKNKKIQICSASEYKERVKTFLEYLDPNIVVERLFSKAPTDNVIFVNWYTSWWKLQDELLKEMEEEGLYQGMNFDYLSGKTLKIKNFV